MAVLGKESIGASDWGRGDMHVIHILMFPAFVSICVVLIKTNLS